ncbi:MAG TPA: response regulator [Cytophagaceae bacterium]|jgi:CheY-like chemotaxis protein|nr:response regulator [Cytophagaceae bacterium]
MKKKFNCTLLVDDDIVSNFLSEKVIQGSDITNELKIAQNGHVAFKYLEKCSAVENPCPELIFLDVNMPVMDAFDFLYLYRQLHKKDKGAIVILTSSDNPSDIEHLSQFEILDYINKPLTKEKMDGLMRKMEEQNILG